MSEDKTNIEPKHKKIEAPDKAADDQSYDQMLEKCRPIAEKVLQEMLDADLLIQDWYYVKRVMEEKLTEIFTEIVLAHWETTMKLVEDSLKFNVNRASEIALGKPHNELSLADIDTMLKKQVDVTDK